MPARIKFDAGAMSQCSSRIKNASADVEAAVALVNSATNNRNWQCQEKNRIESDLSAARSYLKTLNAVMGRFSERCVNAASRFTDVENQFSKVEKAERKKQQSFDLKAQLAKLVKFSKDSIEKLWKKTGGLFLALFGAAIVTPGIGLNPFSVLGLMKNTKNGLKVSSDTNKEEEMRVDRKSVSENDQFVDKEIDSSKVDSSPRIAPSIDGMIEGQKVPTPSYDSYNDRGTKFAGQCTTYAQSRLNDTLGINITPFPCGNGNSMATKMARIVGGKEENGVVSGGTVTGADGLQYELISSPASEKLLQPHSIVSFNTHDRNGNWTNEGHVVYVEDVRNGYVYFTEGNTWNSTDGIIKKLSIEDFLSRPSEYKNSTARDSAVSVLNFHLVE